MPNFVAMRRESAKKVAGYAGRADLALGLREFAA